MDLWTVFITGLLTGGLSCLAVQGGLLAASLAQSDEYIGERKLQKSHHILPILSFLVAKLIAYTAFGFLLGWLGSFFQLSLGMQIFMQLFVVIFMFGTAMSILDVHPIFRYFVIQPPRFLTKLVRQQSKSKSMFGPAILGAFTVFIPCGTTQAMMALAIASGSPILGATILFVFVLGTSPLFFTLGYLAKRLGATTNKRLMRITAAALVLLALINLNNVLALSGSDLAVSFSKTDKPQGPSVSEAVIEFNETTYSPDNITVKAGSEVTLKLKNTAGSGCIQAFTIPKLNIQTIVPVGSEEDITFTAPSTPGKIAFMCSMGMYRGVINVL